MGAGWLQHVVVDGSWREIDITLDLDIVVGLGNGAAVDGGFGVHIECRKRMKAGFGSFVLVQASLRIEEV